MAIYSINGKTETGSEIQNIIKINTNNCKLLTVQMFFNVFCMH